MNDTPTLTTDTLELHASHEIVRDEDVLSDDARAGLEQVSSGFAVILVLGLLVVRVARLVRTSPSRARTGVGRE